MSIENNKQELDLYFAYLFMLLLILFIVFINVLTTKWLEISNQTKSNQTTEWALYICLSEKNQARGCKMPIRFCEWLISVANFSLPVRTHSSHGAQLSWTCRTIPYKELMRQKWSPTIKAPFCGFRVITACMFRVLKVLPSLGSLLADITLEFH